MGFTGFPDEGIRFYEGLTLDNSKAYWTAKKSVYDEAVKAPFEALLDELEPEFGPGKLFRPYRDVRFSKDKSPYKTHAGAYVQGNGSGGFYVQLSADGLFVAAGMHESAPDQVDRLRAAVADDRTGPQLEAVVVELRRAGYDVDGDRLKTAPRGYPADHPRAELLRHRTLVASRSWPPRKWLGTSESLSRIVTSWREMAPLGAWLNDHVGPSHTTPPRR